MFVIEANLSVLLRFLAEFGRVPERTRPTAACLTGDTLDSRG